MAEIEIGTVLLVFLMSLYPRVAAAAHANPLPPAPRLCLCPAICTTRYLTKTLGFLTGIEFRDSNFVIKKGVTREFKPAMVVNVAVGFQVGRNQSPAANAGADGGAAAGSSTTPNGQSTAQRSIPHEGSTIGHVH